MQCPACEHTNTPEAFGDPAKCPACGVYYAKALANKNRKENLSSSELGADPAIGPKNEKPSAWNTVTESVKEGRQRRAADEADVARRRDPATAQAVVIVDFNMSFWSMVMFMVKWAIAAIPAALILLLLFWGAASILGLLGGAGR
ncbi:hypothetical protein ACIGCM_03625 [Pseudomonas sp. NPDC078700]|uniref:hypothetical protein n=1 Tax=Pseudomonas sp. NPDC078700 TaxID=3364424 RepID=UPI0037CC3DA4